MDRTSEHELDSVASAATACLRSPPWARRITARAIDARWWLLGLAIVLAAVSYFPAGRIEFNRSIENMFAVDDPVLGPYQRLKETFGGNEIVLAVYEDPELLSPDGRGIERLSLISERLRQVSGVRDVLSLDRPIGPSIVDPDNIVSTRLREVFAGYTHSTDGRMAAAVCLLEPDPPGATPGGDSRSRTIAQLREVMESLPAGLKPGMVAGEPVLVIEGFRSLEIDGRRLSLWSTLLVALVIVLCFRSLRWVAISLAVVQLALWMTYGLLVAAGVRLTLVSGMLSAIVTVVGIATTVHLLIAYREARWSGLSPTDSLKEAAGRMAAPVVWSLATDAAGFGSLLISKVGPIRDFGLMTTCGSLLVLPCLLLVVPGLTLVGPWDSTPQRVPGEGRLKGVLGWVSRCVERYPVRIGSVVLVLFAMSVVGASRVEVETDFTRNFRADSELVRSYETIESQFGGAGVIDVLLPAPESLRWGYVRSVERLEQRLRTEIKVKDELGQERPGLTKVLSLADSLVAVAPPGIDALPIESARDFAARTGWEAMRARLPAFAATLYAPESSSQGGDDDAPRRHWFRVMLRARERQPAEQKLHLIEQVQRVVDEELARDEWQAWGEAGQPLRGEVTGYFVLLTHLIESTVRDQWTSFGAATLGVFVALLLALRNVRESLIALVPNALPIFLVLGSLGWLGLKVNLGAAMIAAVSMGLSVDSSIHYLLAAARLRREGVAYGESLHRVQWDVGRAVVFSTLALVVGFLVLCRSEFMPTVYFGLLVSLAMVGGLLGNLVLLPLLLRLFIAEARTAGH